MTPRPSALRIGIFALLGLALLSAAVVVVFGVQAFKASEQAIMQFSGSVYGLQAGSPVVFRGVRVGRVQSIGVAFAQGSFAVPVVAQFERDQLQAIRGPGEGEALPALVQQGLSAQLATHSLLTGQLYVDLDLRAGGQAVLRDAQGLVRIPTTRTRFQSLQDQLDRVDLTQMTQDLGATLAAARGLVAGPEVKQTLAELAQASASLARLAKQLDQRVPALAAAAQGTLRQAGDASTRVGTAADRVGGAADRVGAAGSRLDAALSPGSALMNSVQQAAEELGRSAAALRAATSDESANAQSLQRALGDVSRAARAVRGLAEQIEQQPQSLIRGKEGTP
jgi:paraquat-inducible protein B